MLKNKMSSRPVSPPISALGQEVKNMRGSKLAGHTGLGTILFNMGRKAGDGKGVSKSLLVFATYPGQQAHNFGSGVHIRQEPMILFSLAISRCRDTSGLWWWLPVK